MSNAVGPSGTFRCGDADAGRALAEQAAREALVADEGVDEVAAQGAEDAGRLGPAVGDADDVGDGGQVVRGTPRMRSSTAPWIGLAAGVVVAGRDVADRAGGPERLLSLLR